MKSPINYKNFKRHALAVSITSCIVTGQQVLAQVNQIEEIAITGSRIRMTDGMASPVPVTALSVDELQGFDPGGSVSEQLDNLPQFFGTTNAQRAVGLISSGGGAYLNMRGLGAPRTLILFDGARLPPADKRGSVNVDVLPTALIRSVDVVTGGASAAYGADALGGVVNFVLDREFEGLKVETGSGIAEYGDGFRWDMSVAGGIQIGDRLHLIGSIQALHMNQIQRDPEDMGDWWKRWGWVTNPAWKASDPIGTNPQRLTLPWVASTEHSPYGMLWSRKGTSSTSAMNDFSMNGMVFLEDGSGVRPFVKGAVYAAPWASGTTKSMSGGPEAEIYNRAFPHTGVTGNEVANRTFFSALKYDVSDSVSVFGQVMIGRTKANQVVRNGGYEASDAWHATIFRNNAYLPPSVAAAMDAANKGAGIDSFQLWRNGGFAKDAGSEIKIRDRQATVFGTYSWNLGVDVELPNDWDLRASWQSGESKKVGGWLDGLRADRLALAMDAVRDPKTGTIVCNVQLYNPNPAQLAASVVGRLASPGGSPGGTAGATTKAPLASPIGLDNTIRDCIPFNAMTTGRKSAAVMDYVSTPKDGDSIVTQDFAEILVSGELFQGWAGPVSFASGLTWREQTFSDRARQTDIDVLGPPLNVPSLGIRGLGPGWTTGSANLHAFSTIPNISGGYSVWEYFSELNSLLWRAASGPQSLGASLAYRSSTYSSMKDPIDSWKIGLDFEVSDDLRLRATKSRDVREATMADRFDAQSTGANFNDPRFGGAIVATTITRGGNPELIPESADSLVFGFIYQPGWLQGLRASVDWYDINIEDSIGTLGVQRIVDECEINKVQSLCKQIERDPVTGVAGRVFDVPLNVAQARVSGIDYEMSYSMEPDFLSSRSETLKIRAFAGYVGDRVDIPFGAANGPQQAGSLGLPDLTASITAVYTIDAYSLQLQQNYIAPTILNFLWKEGVDVDINTVASGNYTNMRLGYEGELSSGAAWNLGFNVTNLFDRGQPIIAGFGTRGGGQQIIGDYEAYGRLYQLNLKMNF